MKTLLVVALLSTVLFSGCSSMDWTRLLGARTANWTKCEIEDSEANRAAVKEILASVAKQSSLRDDVHPVEGFSYVVVAAYAANCPDTPKQTISLEASVEQSRLTTSLFQAKWRKTRTARYTEIQDRLVSEFKKHFGTKVEFRIYDEVIK